MKLLARSLCSAVLAGLAAAKDEAVVLVVDPVWDDVDSFGTHVPMLKDYKVVKVLTRKGQTQSFDNEGQISLFRTFTYSQEKADAVEATKEICPLLKNLGVPIGAVMPTSDPSVALTDHLADCLGVRGNPAFGPLARARRNKWVMGNAVQNAGLRAMKEQLVSSWAEGKKYLESLDKPVSETNPVIFKIINGAGGEGVVKVHNIDEGKAVFDKECGEWGDTQILIQEYLQGKEYAVDTVSRDGVHKVIAVWFEDFRPANGIFDQYFGFKLLDPNEEFTKRIIDYANKVLDATGLNNGAANTEVKYLEDEDAVCLVEVNARWAGIGWHDGLAVEHAATGLDQYNAAFTAYLDEEGFNNMPAVRPLKQHGAVVFAINYKPGVLRGVPGFNSAKKSDSFLDGAFDSGAAIGKMLPKTTPSTIPMNIALANEDKAVVDADYAHLLNMEKEGRFFNTVQTADIFESELRLDGASISSNGMVALMACAFVAGLAAVVLQVQPLQGEKPDDIEYLAIE